MDNFRDSYFQVDWDLTTKRLRGTYWGKQYDTGRGFAVSVINGGQVVTPTTEVLRLKWEKPDNTTGYVNATIVDGKFIVENIDQMFTVHGSVRADFELSVAGEFVASITFYVNVEKAVAVDAIESSSDFSAFQQSVSDFSTAMAAVTPIAEEIIDARDGEVSVGAKIRSVDAQLAEKASQTELNNNASMYWIPPTQPPARQDLEGWFANAFGWSADQFITNLIEPLRQEALSYITRKTLGKDASGIHDVWRYIFTPSNYKKTIIVGTGIHGGEITPVLAVYRFLYHLVHDWNKYPQLKDIRNNIRIVWIPFQNPYGFTVPRQRKNYNGVDLNRNWDYKFAEYVALGKLPTDSDYQGSAPFSEVETQYILDTLLEFKDATAYLDCHNIGYSLADSVTYNVANAPNKFIYDDVAKWFIRDQTEKTIIYDSLDTPSGYNYALKTLGMVSGNPEFSDSRFGSMVYDSKEMTKAVEWFGNIIIQHAREDIFLSDEPFVIENRYETTGSFVNNLGVGSYAPITPFDFNFNVPSDGILLFDGEIVIKGTDASSQNFICPRIGQVGTNFSVSTLDAGRFEVYNEGNLRSTLPFHASAYVQKTEGNVGKAGVGLSGFTQTGTCMVYRYRGRITFIPTKNLHKFQRYTATTTNVMTKM